MFHRVVDVLLLILLNVFYVNDEPESKFLYTETIKLYVCHCWLFFSLEGSGTYASFPTNKYTFISETQYRSA